MTIIKFNDTNTVEISTYAIGMMDGGICMRCDMGYVCVTVGRSRVYGIILHV